LVTDVNRTICYNPNIEAAIQRQRQQSKTMSNTLDEMKKEGAALLAQLKHQGESMKNIQKTQNQVNKFVKMSDEERAVIKSAMAENDIRDKNFELRKNRKKNDKKTQEQFCLAETNAKNRIHVFPAIPLKTKDIDDKTCLLINRDAIVTAFCQFRQDFKTTLTDHGITTHPKTFWPKICCYSAGDICYKIKHTEASIPFSLSQGGELTKEILYGEILDLLGTNGKKNESVIYEGMMKALKHINKRGMKIQVSTDKIESRLEMMFNNIYLCGPHVFNNPKEDGTKVCQLFYSYHK
jgi:hypothetical protein